MLSKEARSKALVRGELVTFAVLCHTASALVVCGEAVCGGGGEFQYNSCSDLTHLDQVR